MGNLDSRVSAFLTFLRFIIKLLNKTGWRKYSFFSIDFKKSIFLQPQKRTGAVAQLVEQRTENPCVGSSILSSTTS